MESLLTQGLIGLVFVLSIALWSKSGSSNSKEPGSSSIAKKSKKKKKGIASTPPVNDGASSSSQITAENREARQTVAQPVKEIEEQESQSRNGQVNGLKRGKNGKKMTLEEFANKTNEERVEELERQARGNAGDVDIGSDMIDKELQPERKYTKVARIEPKPSESRPLDRTAATDGWNSVGGKAKGMPTPIAASKVADNTPPNAWASSNPFALLPGSGAEITRPVLKSNGSSSSTPKVLSTATPNSTKSIPGAGDVQTKKQRQNAAKAQAKKQEREAAEAERLARLSQHKRQVEAERMKEMFKKQNTPSAPFSLQKGASNGVVQSKASINEKGSLVWD